MITKAKVNPNAYGLLTQQIMVVPSGGGTVRHMYFDPERRAIPTGPSGQFRSIQLRGSHHTKAEKIFPA